MNISKILFVFAFVSLFFVVSSQGDIKATDEALAKEINEFKSQTAAEMFSKPAQVGRDEVNDVNVPKVVFEKIVHDYGVINVGTNSDGEFKFTNAGNGVLRIGKIHSTCGCTVAKLTKRIYKPGESGEIKVTYAAGTDEGTVNKKIYVPTNDPNNRRIALTVKAEIVQKVVVKPEMLNLLLNKENGGCEGITLTSTDDREFSVMGIKSSFDGIKIDFDRAKKGKSIILKPVVDVNKLKENSYGKIEISLTHPESRLVDVRFNVLPKFQLDPRYITLLQAQPGVTEKKELWVLSNYNEDFEIESAKSEKGIVKVLKQEKFGYRYKFDLEVVPPTENNGQMMFIDKLIVKTKKGETLEVLCSGFFTVKQEPGKLPDLK